MGFLTSKSNLFCFCFVFVFFLVFESQKNYKEQTNKKIQDGETGEIINSWTRRKQQKSLKNRHTQKNKKTEKGAMEMI